MTSHSIAWERLDGPGRDACSWRQTLEGWLLEGVAELELGTQPASLHYEIRCTPDFRSLGASVRGSIAGRAVAFEIERSGDAWVLNGAAALELSECVDLDLGFTPATNLLPIRRLELTVGARASSPAAWLDVERGTLAVLPQWYERRSASTYWYEAPSVEYAALLEVDSAGFVVMYPGLWRIDEARRF